MELLRASAHKSMADEVIGRTRVEASTRCWAAASKVASISPAASGRKSLWLAPILREAQVLILDEPTAALDARSEFEVFQRFAELTAGQDGVVYFPSLFNRAHGGPHRSAGRWTHRRRRQTRRFNPSRRPVRRDVRNASSQLSVKGPLMPHETITSETAVTETARNDSVVDGDTSGISGRPAFAATGSEDCLPCLVASASSVVRHFRQASRQARSKTFSILAAVDSSVASTPLTDDARWLRDNSSLSIPNWQRSGGD